MPIVKPKTIHNGVYGFLTYIEKAHKTKNGTLITGFNIPTNAAEAYDAFRETYVFNTFIVGVEKGKEVADSTLSYWNNNCQCVVGHRKNV